MTVGAATHAVYSFILAILVYFIYYVWRITKQPQKNKKLMLVQTFIIIQTIAIWNLIFIYNVIRNKRKQSIYLTI